MLNGLVTSHEGSADPRRTWARARNALFRRSPKPGSNGQRKDLLPKILDSFLVIKPNCRKTIDSGVCQYVEFVDNLGGRTHDVMSTIERNNVFLQFFALIELQRRAIARRHAVDACLGRNPITLLVNKIIVLTLHLGF